MDGDTMKVGLLVEAAQAQQQLAQSSLEQLQVHTRTLDEVVRETVRRTLVDELQELTGVAARTTQSLRQLGRRAELRLALWIVLVAALCAGGAGMVLVRLLPSRAEVRLLDARRQQLSQTVTRLQQLGGQIELRRCGDAGRLCVRIDASAPAFGKQADYRVVRGY